MQTTSRYYPGGDGKAMVDHYKRNVLQGFTVKSEPAREDKVEYAGPWSSQAEAENVKVVRGAWNDAFFSEAEAFPSKDVHDDQIDACSAAYRRVQSGGLASIKALSRW